MKFKALPLTAAITEYELQAANLLDDWRSGDEGALKYFHEHLPRMLDEKIRWLPKRLDGEQLRAAAFDMDDSRTAIARGYDFADWDALSSLAAAVARRMMA